MEAALEYGAAPSLFTKGLPEALPTEAAVPKNWCARHAVLKGGVVMNEGLLEA